MGSIGHCLVSLVAAVIALGCDTGNADLHASDGRIGPGDPDEVDYVSGNRLRAMVYVSDDGARMLHGWFDLQLEQPCWFTVASDGVTRCLPREVLFVGYDDPECSRLVAMAGPSRHYVSILSSDAPCEHAVFSLGESRVAAGLYVHSSTDPAGCVELLAGDLPVRPMTPADPEAFIAASLTREPRGAGLAMEFLEGADGSRQPTNSYDLVHDVTCSERVPWDSETLRGRCVPGRRFAEYEKYADAACTEPVVTAGSCDGSPNEGSVAHVASPTCFFEEPRIGVLGSPLSSIYASSAEQCEQEAVEAGTSYLAIETPVPIDALPALGRAHADGGGLVSDWLVTGDNKRLMVGSFYRADILSPCTPVLMSDCLTHCVPVVPSSMLAFDDEACSVPLAAFSDPPECGEPAKPDVVTAWGTAECGNAVRVLRIGAKMPPKDHVFLGSPAECMGVQWPATTSYYAVTELPPSDFPTLGDAIE